MILQAHRGVAKRYPENTLAAFGAAVGEGYGMIECDPRFTADGRCVFFHDKVLDRLAREKGSGAAPPKGIPVSSLTLAQLRRYEAGSWFGSAFAGEEIPTLEDLIAFAERHPIDFKIDNILGTQCTEEQTERFFSAVERSSAAGRFGFTAADVGFAEKVAARFPDNTLHYDGPFDDESLSALAARVRVKRLVIWLPIRKMAWLPYAAADRESVERVRKYGAVGLWIAVEKEDLELCRRLGADIVETDGTVTPQMLK